MYALWLHSNYKLDFYNELCYIESARKGYLFSLTDTGYKERIPAALAALLTMHIQYEIGYSRD